MRLVIEGAGSKYLGEQPYYVNNESSLTIKALPS
jgi:hypothetical protein